ncbi:MAG: cupin domain-containing protein [Synergistaceae bacterium]|nr:cupin domain-containing protein [Synergistaceae bacterium]
MNLAAFIQALHFQIHDRVRAELMDRTVEYLTYTASFGAGDISYRIDVSAEKIIDEYFLANPLPGGAVVISEGLGIKTYPAVMNPNEARYRIIIDPLDGTREIMYDKRSCWILTGIAPNMGAATNLQDIFLSVQTEIPPTIQIHSRVLVAEKGKGANQSIWDVKNRALIHGNVPLQTSRAKDLRHGFAVFANFFPGMKESISKIEESVLRKHIGDIVQNDAAVFTDQYISSAGQLYLLAAGKYRFVADLRGIIGDKRTSAGETFSLCCHPYDLSAYLIFTEAGGVLTDISGKAPAYPLDLDTNCSWLAYCNEDLRTVLAPLIHEEVEELEFYEKIRTCEKHFLIEDKSEIMPNGEIRIRSIIGDGDGLVVSVAPKGGAWQKAHHHKYTTEIIVVKEGRIAILNGQGNIKIISRGDYIHIDTGLRHNVYMYPNTVTYTLKCGTMERNVNNDWHPDYELDKICEGYDVHYMEALELTKRE